MAMSLGAGPAKTWWGSALAADGARKPLPDVRKPVQAYVPSQWGDSERGALGAVSDDF